jgi:RNA polymerase sigma factor (sigma-70 family)
MADTTDRLLGHIRRLARPPVPASDDELLARFVGQHDEEAFAELVHRHGPMVLGVCRRILRDADAAEDAFQAAFLVLVRKAAGLRCGASLGAWLHGVARRLALECRRAEGRRRHREAEGIPLGQVLPDPLDEVSARELLRVLDEELGHLAERYRLPLVLCVLEGRSVPEAARQLGWSPGSVRGRLARGRACLQARLARRGLAVPAGVAGLLLAPRAAEAALPAALAARAVSVALGSGASVSARAAALAEGGLTRWVLARGKVGLMLLLAAGAITAGWSAHVLQGPAVARPGPQQAAEDRPTGDQQPSQGATDRYGDPLPASARARLGTVRLRAGHMIHLLQCLAGNKTFVSVATEEECVVLCEWDLATGRRLSRVQWHGRSVYGAALSPDGKTLLISTYDGRRDRCQTLLRDVPSGRRTGEVPVAGSIVEAVAFAPDGKTFATAVGETVRLWDTATITEARRINDKVELNPNVWKRLAFSADGKVLAAAGREGTLRLWEAATGREIRSAERAVGPDAALAFSPDGKTLAIADKNDKEVRLWDSSSGKDVRRLRGERGTTALAFSPDGKTLACGEEREEGKTLVRSVVHSWDVATGREVGHCAGHLFGVQRLAFSRDGKRLISGGGGTGLRVWDVATGKDAVPLAENESWANSVAFSPDGRLLACAGMDSTIRLWDPSSGNAARLFEEGHRQRVWQIHFRPDGKSLVSSGHDGSMRLWDVATGREVRQLVPPGQPPRTTHDLSPDGRTLAVWSTDGMIRLKDAGTGEELRHMKGTPGWVGGALFSPDGRKVLSSSSPAPGDEVWTVQLWQAATGTELRHWTVRRLSPLVFSPDGQTLAGGDGHFLPNGITDRTFYLWDVATGKERHFAAAQPARIFSMTFSPDGRMLAWGDAAGTVTLWELAAGRVRHRFTGQHSFIDSLAFSPDGKSMASASADTTVMVWDVTGRFAGTRPGALSAAQVRRLWDDLAADDAGRAWRAVGLLAAAPTQAVPLLRDKLRPAAASPDRDQLTRLIADLASENYAVRKKAVDQLRALRERAEPALREAARGRLDAEARKRVDELLGELEAAVLPPDELRPLRGVEVLEHIGTPEARKVLQALAAGAPQARLTQDARASLRRLARQ